MIEKFLKIFMLLSVASLLVLGHTGCEMTDDPDAPIKLDAPALALLDDVVYWSANYRAAGFEISINGEVSQVEKGVTAHKICDGQTVKVRAVGDGVEYSTSDWSNSISLVGQSTDKEPGHVVTTIAALAANTPLTGGDVIYEVTGIWSLKNDGDTYGNGRLYDELGNQIDVYGLCGDASVITYADGAYAYKNDKSYLKAGIDDGDVITVGMIYNVKYGNYSCYLIEISDKIEVESDIDLGFVMINDTHGSLTDSSSGNSIGRVDSLIQYLERRNEDYIFIHNGDAFQGSYVCVETYGRALLEALNVMELDCFVIGNHEFDWGLDKIAAYADGDDSNGEASFPFLGANIYYDGTTTRPDWIDAYTIVERDGVKVGIIGVMGYGQETSILTRYVEDYYFADPLGVVEAYAKHLRVTEGCDVVVVATHDYDEYFNNNVAAMSGDFAVDAIFCAHTHQSVRDSLTRGDAKTIPVVQCYDKNKNAVEVVLELDDENDYEGYTSRHHEPEDYEISLRVQAVIQAYREVVDMADDVIGTTSGSLSKSLLGGYATEALLNHEYIGYDFDGVDVSVINTGGVRAQINSGEITRAEVFEVFPFNNAVVLVNLSGALIKSLYSENENYLYIDVSDEIGSYSRLDDDTIYQLAVIDYVFEGVYYYQFDDLEEGDYIETEILLRDLLMVYLDEKY